MATWITHLMIADRVLETVPGLDRQHFCVGNIAPDCNIENEDWTQFVPSREITHWMSSDRKTADDAERFYRDCYEQRKYADASDQELLFLLGYYAHLLTDAEFQRHTRDSDRVTAVWQRLKEHPVLAAKAAGLPETWDTVKQLINPKERLKDIYTIEAEYLENHPNSGYLTEILPLTSFPDYLDYLPHGAIVRKIGVMGYRPVNDPGKYPFVCLSREEFETFLSHTVKMVMRKITRI